LPKRKNDLEVTKVVDNKTVEAFKKDGGTTLRRVFIDWVQVLKEQNA